MFNFNYNVDDLRALLDDIDLEMVEHIDANDEPLEDFYLLQDVFDNIRYQNKK